MLLYVSILLGNIGSLVRLLQRDGASQEQAIRVARMTGMLYLVLLLEVVVCAIFALKSGEKRMSLLGLVLAAIALLLELIVT